ncbi:MAG: hypothetical protein NTV49_05390 [Kiritimatiellaeota bacterium]|nr:hypothetical protein [Kiritimatiellota bacterium]
MMAFGAVTLFGLLVIWPVAILLGLAERMLRSAGRERNFSHGSTRICTDAEGTKSG